MVPMQLPLEGVFEEQTFAMIADSGKSTVLNFQTCSS